MARVLFATTNAGKLRELRLLVGDALEVLGLADLAPIPEPAEDADTFEENAANKARAYAAASGLPALADDSGLCVDALGGRPGVLLRALRAGRRPRALREAAARAGGRAGRRAHARPSAARSASPGRTGRVEVEVGALPGPHRARAARGRTASATTPSSCCRTDARSRSSRPEEKGALSHRGAAFRLMRPRLLAL